MKRLHRMTKTVAAIALLAAVASIGALAHGGDATEIHGCVLKDSKLVRIVDPNDACKATETALDWNAQGPAGPQGAPGPAGPQGPTGPEGPAGITGLVVVEAVSSLDSNAVKYLTATCPPGKIALDGSAAVIPSSAPAFLMADGFSFPTGGLPNRREVIAKEASPFEGSWQLVVKVMCASLGT